MNVITIRINLLLLTLTFCNLMQQEVMAFQQTHTNANIKRCSSIYKRNGVVASLASTDIDDDAEGAATIQNQIFSSAFSMCLIGSMLTTPQLSNAADDKLPGMSITNYAKEVFGSPLVGSTPGIISSNQPIQIDPKYTTREERNRAYDEAFQQDARDRDAYYGQLAMKKRKEAEQSVSQYREQLGLDGKGDTWLRVGEERVEGLALKELKADYLSKQQEDDSSAVSGSTE